MYMGAAEEHEALCVARRALSTPEQHIVLEAVAP
jgi:hypothetical protein